MWKRGKNAERTQVNRFSTIVNELFGKCEEKWKEKSIQRGCGKLCGESGKLCEKVEIQFFGVFHAFVEM